MREMIHRAEARLTAIEAGDPQLIEFARGRLHAAADAWGQYLRHSTGRIWWAERTTAERPVRDPHTGANDLVIRLEVTFRPGELVELAPEERLAADAVRARVPAEAADVDAAARRVLAAVLGGS